MFIINKEQLAVQLDTLGYDILNLKKDTEKYPQFENDGIAIVDKKDLNWQPKEKLPIRVFIDEHQTNKLMQMGKPIGSMAFWHCYDYAKTPIHNR